MRRVPTHQVSLPSASRALIATALELWRISNGGECDAIIHEAELALRLGLKPDSLRRIMRRLDHRLVRAIAFERSQDSLLRVSINTESWLWVALCQTGAIK